MNCSVARSLDIVGEWWTLMIVRDVFMGLHRFEEIRRDLSISKKVLTDRLATLVERGVLKKVNGDHGHPEYRLTRKGADLHDVIVAVMQWGDRWEAPNGAPLQLVHDCGNVTRARMVCDCCDSEVTAFNVTSQPGPGMKKRARR